MKVKNPDNNIQFLSGGGEMGKLTREKDWSKTSLGDPMYWPQSLHITLGIILNSKFPMFLFWGEELICFYNDAFRPSLGKDGKHPAILGSKGEEFWQETWHILKPLIDGVLAGGEASLTEDQLVPIYRNGKMEDAYWTYCLSPVNDETGKPAGVLSTSTETTEKIIGFTNIKESDQRFRNMVAQAPVAICVLRGPDYVVETINEKMLELLGKPAEVMSNQPFFEAMPDAAAQGFEELLDKVRKTGIPFVGNEAPISIIRNGVPKDIFVNYVYEPLYGENKTISGVIVVGTEVTAQVIARKKIEESEETLRHFFMQTPALMHILKGPEHIFGLANSEYQKFIGNRNPIGKKLLEAMPELAGQNFIEILDNVYKTGETYSGTEMPVFLTMENGQLEERFVNVNYIAINNAQEQRDILAFAYDVTEQVNSRKRIEESEQQLHNELANTQELQKISTQLIFEDKAEEIYQQILDVAMKLMGSDFASIQIYDSLTEQLLLLGNKNFHTHSEKFWQTVDVRSGTPCGEALKTRQRIIITDIETNAITSSDEEELKSYRLTGIRSVQSTPLLSRDGSLIGMVSTHWNKVHEPSLRALSLFDVLARQAADLIISKKAEKRLKESEEKFRSLVQTLPQLIWVTDPQGNAEFASFRWKEYTGFEPAGEEEWKAIVHPHDYDTINAAWVHSLTTGNLYSHDVRLKSKTGDYRWYTVKGEPVLDKDNKIVKWVGAFTDNHAEKSFTKELEEKVTMRTAELEQKNIELERMNKELQSFAYISSHDLQEPLRKIQTFATRIKEKEENNLSEQGKDSFKRMQDAANRMQTLIQDLFAYSRTSITERTFETTDLNKIIDEVKEDLNENINEKHATIEAKELGNANIIPFQFRQLMLNLISNALKFSRPETPPHIKITTEIVKGKKLNNEKLSPQIKYCHITVSDNGIGFEKQYNEKIFEVFQRLHSKNEYIGTGIGLSIVKKIVDNHEGIITATSELNEGATFDIYIPA